MAETQVVHALAPAAASDDESAFEALYRTHAKRIYSLAYRFAGNAAEAEELLQEIFLQAYRKLGGFRREAALGTWLHRLAVNRCVDHVRSRAARQDAVTEPLNADHPPPGRAGAGPITHLDLERAIAQLPDGCRMAFVLHDVASGCRPAWPGSSHCFGRWPPWSWKAADAAGASCRHRGPAARRAANVRAAAPTGHGLSETPTAGRSKQ